MGVEVKIDTSNLSRLVRDLSPGQIDQLVRAAAFEAEGRAKQSAPVDTGYLRNSIQTRVLGIGEAEVGTSAQYAAYVEMGTSRQRAQPYLVPAARKAVDNLIAALEARLRRAK